LDLHWHWISAAFTAIFYTILNFWAVPSADFPISSEIADVQTNPNKSMHPPTYSRVLQAWQTILVDFFYFFGVKNITWGHACNPNDCFKIMMIALGSLNKQFLSSYWFHRFAFQLILDFHD
jgi:hypothetical protein